MAEGGQLEIARSNRIGRLVFVAMGRGHTFDSLESVQTEVAPFIMDLIPKDEKGKVWKRLLAGEKKSHFWASAVVILATVASFIVVHRSLAESFM